MKSSAGFIAHPAFCPRAKIIPATLRPMSAGPGSSLYSTMEENERSRRKLARLTGLPSKAEMMMLAGV